MLGSELCRRKEHTHRMIEVPSVSHAAWAYCRIGKSFKMLKREGRGGGVSHRMKKLMGDEGWGGGPCFSLLTPSVCGVSRLT